MEQLKHVNYAQETRNSRQLQWRWRLKKAQKFRKCIEFVNLRYLITFGTVITYLYICYLLMYTIYMLFVNVYVLLINVVSFVTRRRSHRKAIFKGHVTNLEKGTFFCLNFVSLLT